MDSMDEAIVNELKQNARASASGIGKLINLSTPAVAERIRKLERAGIITRYTVRIDREKTGKGVLAFLLVQISGTEHTETFRRAVTAHPCVLECHHVAGAYDYLLKVAAEDMRTLETFITQTLKTMRGVSGTNTMIALKTLKEEINA